MADLATIIGAARLQLNKPVETRRVGRVEEYFANLHAQLDKSWKIIGYCFPTKAACDEWARLGSKRMAVVRIWRPINDDGWHIEVLPDDPMPNGQGAG